MQPYSDHSRTHKYIVSKMMMIMTTTDRQTESGTIMCHGDLLSSVEIIIGPEVIITASVATPPDVKEPTAETQYQRQSTKQSVL